MPTLSGQVQSHVTYHQHDCSSLWTAVSPLQLIFDSTERERAREMFPQTLRPVLSLSLSSIILSFETSSAWGMMSDRLKHSFGWEKLDLNSDAATSNCNLALLLFLYLFFEDNGFFLTQLLWGWGLWVCVWVLFSGCSLLLWHLALLSQVVGAGAYFAPKGTFGNVWGHFWLSQLWGCLWHLVHKGQECC